MSKLYFKTTREMSKNLVWTATVMVLSERFNQQELDIKPTPFSEVEFRQGLGRIVVISPTIEQTVANKIQKKLKTIHNMSRTEPYTGPFPRKKHSHRCLKCGGNAVACYKKQCTQPQTVEQCMWCKPR